MTDAIDIYRAAKLVIDRHGEEAGLYAAAKTAVLAGEGTSRALPSGVKSPLRSGNCSARDDQGRQ